MKTQKPGLAIATVLLVSTLASAEGRGVPKFAEIDVNDDGSIDRKEVKFFEESLARTLDVPEDKLRVVFENIDRNKDELIDLGEYLSIRAYCT